MVYVYIFVPLIFIAYFAWNAISGNRNLKKVKQYAEDPSSARIALWVGIDKINGQEPDFEYSYWKKIENKEDNSTTDVAVLLVKAGEYQLTVSNKSGEASQTIEINANIKPGVTYVLKSDEDGVNLSEESNSALYKL